MNKRIEDLIKICTEKVPYYPTGNDGHPEYNIVFNKEKFAELLINECAFVAWKYDPTEEGGCYISEKIKQYFGIQE